MKINDTDDSVIDEIQSTLERSSASCEKDKNSAQSGISSTEFLKSLEKTHVGERPFIACDFSKFDRYFDDQDISDADKIELLQTLWNFVVASVSFNLGIHPIDQARAGCGKHGAPAPKNSKTGGKLLDSKDSQSKHTSLTQEYSSCEKGESNG